MNLKKSIKQACLNKEVTQKAIAEKLGFSPTQLQVIMRRNSASTVMLLAISDAFGIKLSEFIALGE